MRHRLLPAFSGVLLAFALVPAPSPARAFDFQVSNPIVFENVAVYPIRGGGAGGPSPLTLDQAMAQGAVKITEGDHGPIMIQNTSNRSVFVQAGTLIAGGLQDQVVATGFVLPPGSGVVPLATFCVDPFRATARKGEDAKTFTATNMLFPWRLAKLSLFAGDADSKAIWKIRQAALWWSVDTLRTDLAAVLGGPIEPPKPASWDQTGRDNDDAHVGLAARRSTWITSLPLALQSRRLEPAQRAYLAAFKSVGQMRGGVIGAAFVINGEFAGAELYQSPTLFHQMWPSVLRSYVTEALSIKTQDRQAPLPVSTVAALIKSSAAGSQRAAKPDNQTTIRDSEAAIYLETQAAGGNWVHRGVVPKRPGEALGSPEAVLVQILDAGQVNDRAIATLGEKELVVLNPEEAGTNWSATIKGPVDGPLAMLNSLGTASRQDDGPMSTTRLVVLALWTAFLAFLLRSIVTGPLRHIRMMMRRAAARTSTMTLNLIGGLRVAASRCIAALPRHTRQAANATVRTTMPPPLPATVDSAPRLKLVPTPAAGPALAAGRLHAWQPEKRAA